MQLKSLAKTPTGITGFDEITGGGLPSGRPTLLCGAAGCGKTLFDACDALPGGGVLTISTVLRRIDDDAELPAHDYLELVSPTAAPACRK